MTTTHSKKGAGQIRFKEFARRWKTRNSRRQKRSASGFFAAASACRRRPTSNAAPFGEGQKVGGGGDRGWSPPVGGRRPSPQGGFAKTMTPLAARFLRGCQWVVARRWVAGWAKGFSWWSRVAYRAKGNGFFGAAYWATGRVVL